MISKKNINKQALIELLKEDFNISFGHAEIKRSETLQENWIVRYEDYFNPHGNPKSLFSQKSFNDINNAVDFFILNLSD